MAKTRSTTSKNIEVKRMRILKNQVDGSTSSTPANGALKQVETNVNEKSLDPQYRSNMLSIIRVIHEIFFARRTQAIVAKNTIFG